MNFNQSYSIEVVVRLRLGWNFSLISKSALCIWQMLSESTVLFHGPSLRCPSYAQLHWCPVDRSSLKKPLVSKQPCYVHLSLGTPTYHGPVLPRKNGNGRTNSYTFCESRAVHYPRLTYRCVPGVIFESRVAVGMSSCFHAGIAQIYYAFVLESP